MRAEHVRHPVGDLQNFRAVSGDVSIPVNFSHRVVSPQLGESFSHICCQLIFVLVPRINSPTPARFQRAGLESLGQTEGNFVMKPSRKIHCI